MNRAIVKSIQVFVTLALLLLVVDQAGLFSGEGRRELIEMLKNARFDILLLSLAVGILINMSSALKWYMLVRAKGIIAGYWRIFCYYLIGQFYNQILPTSVGGDVVRSYQLGKYAGRQADALASVFVERYSGVLVLLLVASIAVISQLALFGVKFVLFSLFGFSCVLGIVAWMLLDHRFYLWVRRHTVASLPFSGKIFDKLDKLLDSINVYRQNRAALMWAVINSLVFYFIAVVNVYVTCLVFDLNISFVDMLVATPIIMLIMNIPISIGNLGLMEFAYISIFQLLGYSPALALSVALLMRVKSLFDAAIGGVMHPFLIENRKTETPE